MSATRSAIAPIVRRTPAGQPCPPWSARLVAAFGGCALVALAGCASTATESSDARPTSDTVTVLTYDSYAISKATLREFTDRTRLQVEIIRGGDAAQVVNRALLTQGSPEADVLFGVDNNLLSRATGQGLFVPYAAEGLDAVPQRYRLDPEQRVTPVDVGDVCVNYDRAYFRQRDLAVPRTLDDLAQPRYRDLLVVENPATSSPGLAFLLATVAEYGEEDFAGYWQRLRDNGVDVENSWDTAYQERFSGGAGKGNRPLVVSYASSPPAEVVFAESPPRDGEAPTGVLMGTCYRQIEFAGVLSNAANPARGEELIDFMLTRTYQEDLPLSNFVFPVLPGAKLPKVFRENARLAADPLSLPPDAVAANRERWVGTWTDVVQR